MIWSARCGSRLGARSDAGVGEPDAGRVGAEASAAEIPGAVCSSGGQMAEGHWAPTPEEAARLAECSAVVYGHDGIYEVVALDALPKELATYVRQGERDEARKAAKEVLRKSAPRGVKISHKIAKARGLIP